MSDLPVGRELDALVAGQVMGTKRADAKFGVIWPPEGGTGQEEGYFDLPHYSTDIAAA